MPDVLVKGGDYKVKDVVGHKDVGSWGGKVKIIPMVPGLSTTNIIKKILIHSFPTVVIIL